MWRYVDYAASGCAAADRVSSRCGSMAMASRLVTGRRVRSARSMSACQCATTPGNAGIERMQRQPQQSSPPVPRQLPADRRARQRAPPATVGAVAEVGSGLEAPAGQAIDAAAHGHIGDARAGGVDGVPGGGIELPRRRHEARQRPALPLRTARSRPRGAAARCLRRSPRTRPRRASAHGAPPAHRGCAGAGRHRHGSNRAARARRRARHAQSSAATNACESRAWMPRWKCGTTSSVTGGAPRASIIASNFVHCGHVAGATSCTTIAASFRGAGADASRVHVATSAGTLDSGAAIAVR